MNTGGIDIAKILLTGNYITAEDLEKANQQANIHKTNPIDYLFSQHLLTKDLLGQAVAESLHVAYADLNTTIPSAEQVLKIPEDIAKKFRVVLFTEEPKRVVVTTDNPGQKNLVVNLKKVFPKVEVALAYSLTEDIDALFIYYREPLQKRLDVIITAGEQIALKCTEQIFEDALVYRASDIHIEPHEGMVSIRFRIDGVLREVAKIEKTFYENILNRVKVLSKLRTDEHFLPQDGSLRYHTAGGPVAMRVSITPTLDGEKIVIRLLSQYIRSFTLGDLGLSNAGQDSLMLAAKQPFGMILVVGPTGSGKTTTLYAVLSAIDRPEVNITTIEDPVEYKIATANQIQIDTKTDMTFATGLRSILRQDPDIILVGEIRDHDTAEIAVNAALTGHLLFSTFHANNAATAIPRLLDIGIEPFLVASTLELIIAQRLVRKLCEACRFGTEVPQTTLAKLLPAAKIYFPNKTTTLYQSKGCKSCQGTGFKGRTAVFEAIRITPEMEALITKSPSEQQITLLAREQGSRQMFDDGIEKVRNGITTIEELLRVVPVPDQPIELMQITNSAKSITSLDSNIHTKLIKPKNANIK